MGQLVPPNDTGVIEQVEAITLSELKDYLEIDLSEVQTLGKNLTTITYRRDTIDPEAFKDADLKMILLQFMEQAPFLHCRPWATWLEPILVEEQMVQDPGFQQ